MDLAGMIEKAAGPTGSRLVVYAETKAGKTTLASQAPKPLFLGTDDGHRRLDVDGLPAPATWLEFVEQLTAVADGAKAGGYGSVVIDTINGIADLCSVYICETQFGGQWSNAKTGFLAWGGHQGWAAVSEEMKRILPLLDRLVDDGLWVILLAHQKVEKVSDPIEGEYDRFSPAIHRNVWSRLAAWADAILRIDFDKFRKKDDDSGKRRLATDGLRVLHCSATVAEVAGCRAGYELPAVMPLAWSEIEERLGKPDTTILAEAKRLIGELPDADRAKALKYLGIKQAGNIANAPPYKVKTLIGKLSHEAEDEANG